MRRFTQGRPRKLTDEQARQARARYRLWRANSPRRIASELGISVETLRQYVLPLGNHYETP